MKFCIVCWYKANISSESEIVFVDILAPEMTYLISMRFSWWSAVYKMNLKNVNIPKMPGGAASALIKLGVVAGLGVYGIANSLYNVDGGHRAIVFNRIVGIKDKVLFCFFSAT